MSFFVDVRKLCVSINEMVTSYVLPPEECVDHSDITIC